MPDEDLLAACKVGLDIPLASTAFNGGLSQRISTVKGYMKGAGVSQTMLNSDLAVGTIVMGVSDLWQLKSGEIRFSPLFHTFVNQLSINSLNEEEEEE